MSTWLWQLDLETDNGKLWKWKTENIDQTQKDLRQLMKWHVPQPWYPSYLKSLTVFTPVLPHKTEPSADEAGCLKEEDTRIIVYIKKDKAPQSKFQFKR